MKLLNIVDEGIVWKNPYPAARALLAYKGQSVNLGSGELIHAMQVGQARSSRDSRCVILRSIDHGRTWAETNPLISIEDRDARFSYFGARMGLTSDGTLWASSVKLDLAEPEDPRWTRENAGWMNAENFICRSTDRGHTWSKPHDVSPRAPVGGFPVLSSPVTELASGELLLVFEPFFTETLQKMRHEVTALYSRDGGQTWGEQTILAQDSTGRLIYFDPRLARLPDGRWICMFWTHDKKRDESLNTTLSYSDDGHSWTEPQPTPLWGFLTLPLTLADGRLLAVYNHRRIPQGIRCAVSEDGGQSWDMESEYVLWDQQARRVTGEPASESRKRDWEGSSMAEMFTWDFGIPHPVLLDDGSVLVTFYATQMDHIMHQRYVRFTID